MLGVTYIQLLYPVKNNHTRYQIQESKACRLNEQLRMTDIANAIHLPLGYVKIPNPLLFSSPCEKVILKDAYSGIFHDSSY